MQEFGSVTDNLCEMLRPEPRLESQTSSDSASAVQGQKSVTEEMTEPRPEGEGAGVAAASGKRNQGKRQCRAIPCESIWSFEPESASTKEETMRELAQVQVQ